MSTGAMMTKEIEAVYEHGIIRPLQPLDLPEGARLDVIVISHEETKTNGNTAEVLKEIAALPLEGASDEFAGRDHDSVLYPKK
jgi:predicted DNA-binding antitoxin AbrB/MazE fold protein